MNLSFTGTRHGMSVVQKAAFVRLLMATDVRSFSHDCCVGADIEAHYIVRQIFGRTVRILVYPSNAKTKAPIPEDSDLVARPRDPLKRNEDVVRAGRDLLIATPMTDVEVLRSGTWSAIRFARKIGVPDRVLPRFGIVGL